MIDINVNENVETIEMYQWGQQDDWTEFGDYDCPDIPRKHYTGPHRLDALLVMSDHNRMILVCKDIADQIILAKNEMAWGISHDPQKQGWLYVLAYRLWQISSGRVLEWQKLPENVRQLSQELGFSDEHQSGRGASHRAESTEYARVLYPYLSTNYPHLMGEKDEDWWNYFFNFKK